MAAPAGRAGPAAIGRTGRIGLDARARAPVEPVGDGESRG